MKTRISIFLFALSLVFTATASQACLDTKIVCQARFQLIYPLGLIYEDLEKYCGNLPWLYLDWNSFRPKLNENTPYVSSCGSPLNVLSLLCQDSNEEIKLQARKFAQSLTGYRCQFGEKNDLSVNGNELLYKALPTQDSDPRYQNKIEPQIEAELKKIFQIRNPSKSVNKKEFAESKSFDKKVENFNENATQIVDWYKNEIAKTNHLPPEERSKKIEEISKIYTQKLEKLNNTLKEK